MNDQDKADFEPRVADWLEGDPNDAPDQALQVVLAALPSVKQRRAMRLPWRTFDMNASPKFALAAVAVVIVVGGAIAILRPAGLTGTAATPSAGSPDQSSGTSPQSPATVGESPVASSAAQAFSSKGSPPFALDLSPEWVTLDTGDTVKLAHVSKDFMVASAEISYLDQIKVIGEDLLNKPAPTDLIGWLATNPLMRPASEAVPTTIAGLPATRLDVIGSPLARPSGNYQSDYRPGFLNKGSGELTIVTGEPWTFFLIEGPDGARLLVSMREPTPDGLALTEQALSTLRFP